MNHIRTLADVLMAPPYPQEGPEEFLSDISSAIKGMILAKGFFQTLCFIRNMYDEGFISSSVLEIAYGLSITINDFLESGND